MEIKGSLTRSNGKQMVPSERNEQSNNYSRQAMKLKGSLKNSNVKSKGVLKKEYIQNQRMPLEYQ